MKTTSYRFLCMSAFVWFWTIASAQTNFRPGFIITLQKDTVYGQIDFRTDQMNAKRCTFKMNEEAEPQTYHPFEILGYRFTDDGKYYISKSVKLKSTDVPKPVFLECLFQGMKSLYYYEVDSKTPVYFVESGDEMIKVDAPALSKNVSRYQFSGQKDRYIPILHYAFEDCPELADKIDHTPFSHKGLVNLAKEYHYAMCKSEEDCTEFEVKNYESGIKWYFMPYAGLGAYTVPGGSSIGSGRISSDMSYLFGVDVSANSVRWMSAISAVTGVSFSHGAITDQIGRSLSFTYFTIKLGMRFTTPKVTKVRPFAEAGVDFNTVLGSNDVLEGTYPAFYINAGLTFQLPNKKHAISVFGQFKGLRDTVAKARLMNGWAGAIGYTF